jgi:hypothetical protein
MKQTAVEQLGIAFIQWQKDWDNFEETGKNKPVSYDEFIKPFLEMEKQQKDKFVIDFHNWCKSEDTESLLHDLIMVGEIDKNVTIQKLLEIFKNK